MKNIKSFIAGLSISALLVAGSVMAIGVNSGGFGTPILGFPVGSELVIGSSTPLSDSGGVLTLQTVDTIDATTETTIESAIDTLANLTSIQGQTITIGGTTSINQNVSTTGAPTFSGATITNGLTMGATAVLTDVSNTLTLSAVDALDSTTETTIESAIDTLAGLTSATIAGVIVTTPSADVPLSAGSGVTVTSHIMRVAGDGSAVSITATPSLVDATDGVCTKIQGTSDTNTVELVDAGTLASTGLALSATGSILGKGDILEVCYDAGDDLWYEVSRSNN